MPDPRPNADTPLSDRSDPPVLGGGQTPDMPKERQGAAIPSTGGVGNTGGERPTGDGGTGMSGAETNATAPGGGMADPASRSGRTGGDIGRNG
jgi:hypothetical protein